MLAPEPFLTSVVLAGGLVAAAGSEEQRTEVLGALSAGESVLAFAHAEPGTALGCRPPTGRDSPRPPATTGRSPASRSRCRTAPAPTSWW